MVQKAAEVARHAGQREGAAQYGAGAATWHAFFGNAAEARRLALDVLGLSKARDVEYGAAFALALSGDSARAQALADGLEKRFPEDTCVLSSYLPVLRALLALKHGEPPKALELLRAAGQYELGTPCSSFNGNFGSLYPIYVRGEAFLAGGQGAQAAAEFQKIVNHPGIVLSDPVGAVARYKLGKALAMSGDMVRAKSAYQDFLALWKDADSDINILREAKAEYAKLR